MPKLIDLTGHKFGLLTVINRVENDTRGQRRWLCKCHCGKEIIATTANLRCGNVKSCGCLRIYKCAEIGKLSRKHGQYPKRLYHIWENMRTRCNNTKHHDYRYYGGRGITICSEWNDFSIFREWALNNGYSETLTLDRIDNNGQYRPENCRWVTRKIQQRNKRNNILYDGKTLSEWSEITGICKGTLLCRIKSGWSFENTIKIPVKR